MREKRERYQANPEIRAKYKEWRTRWKANNRDYVRELNRRWAEANPEKVAESNRKWAQANPHAILQNVHRRRARLASAPVGDFSQTDWEYLLEMHEYHCAYCHRADVKLTQDHIVPLSKGGAHTWTNIAPACLSCNSSKGDRDLMEWLAWRAEREEAQMARAA